MRNQRPHPNPRRWPSRTLAAALAFAAFATVPAIAAANTASPADQPSDLSLTFAGQTGTTAWSANGLTVTANATTDASSPIEKVVCSVDQGASTTTIGAQQKVPVTGNGAHIVSCYPISWDGTQGTAEFATVQIDDQIPAVTLTGTAPSPTGTTGPRRSPPLPPNRRLSLASRASPASTARATRRRRPVPSARSPSRARSATASPATPPPAPA